MTLPYAEPYKIKMTEAIRTSTRAEREAWIREARYNLFKLRSDQVTIDLLTDSGTGSMSDRQWAAMMTGDESYAGASSYFRLKETIESIFGMPYFLPTHQGRAAENVIFSALLKAGDIVPGNSHFDTTKGHIEFRRCHAVDCTIDDAADTQKELPFKGEKDIAKLEGEIAELEEILSSEENIKKVISDELAAVNKKYVMPRRTGRIEPHEVIEVSLEPEVEEYPVTIMLSRDGYLKKMTDRVLKKATTLKYKDGDKPFIEFPSSNTHELLVFTNKSQVYKCKVAAFEDTKSAQLGSYLPTDLEMEPDESVIWVIDPEDYKADVLFVFENGRVVRVALSGYVTKTNRKRLKNAIYGGSKLLYAQVLKEDRDIALVSSDYRLMNFNTSLLKTKTTTNTQGVQAFTAKKGRSVTTVGTTEEILGAGVSAEKFTAQSLPSAGALMKENDMPSLFD